MLLCYQSSVLACRFHVLSHLLVLFCLFLYYNNISVRLLWRDFLCPTTFYVQDFEVHFGESQFSIAENLKSVSLGPLFSKAKTSSVR